MHQHRIIAQISLIFSILNLVLAAPVLVQGIHEARDSDDDKVIEQDMAAMPEKSGETEAASTSSPNGMDGSAALDRTASSPDAIEGSMSSGYTPQMSPGSPSSGHYLWLLKRPARLTLGDSSSASLHASTPESASPRISSSVSSEALQELALAMPYIPPWWEIPPQPLPLAHIPRPLSPGLPETYSPPDYFSPSSNPPSSLSTMPAPSLSSGPPTVAPSENAEHFNKGMMKKVGIIVAGVVIVGGAIASIVGVQFSKHHKTRDYQDS